MGKQKPLEEMTIMDDLIFGNVMRHEAFCKPFLEEILNVKIKKIEYLHDQETFSNPSALAKSIRMDVYVEDSENTVYDLDVQTTDKHNLGKRMRFYQSVMDIRAIEKGVDYRHLKKSFVIFICNFDPFKKGRYIYTIESRCKEDPELLLKDEAQKIIVCTKGTEGTIGEELKAVLRYMDTGVASTEYTEALNAEVEVVKADEKVRMQYMMLADMISTSRYFAEYSRVVKMIRLNSASMSISDMARIFVVSERNCQEVIAMIREHPDWDDLDVAEEVDWDD